MPQVKKNELAVDALESLAENIISLAKLDDLPEGDKKYLKDNLLLQLNRRLGLIIVENLDEESMKKYAQLVEDSPIPNSEKLQEFLEGHLPNYKEKIKEGLEEFANDIVSSLGK